MLRKLSWRANRVTKGPDTFRCADVQTRLLCLLCAVTAASAATAGAALSLLHPLWPAGIFVAFCGWCLLTLWRPDLWPFVVLAGLPLFNFSPWSGWFALDEFDLLVLGTIAGGYARLALSHPAVGAPTSHRGQPP